MDQVIEVPAVLPPYPDTAKALNPAECVLLIAMRWWVADYREGLDPMPRLCDAMETAGAPDAALSVDRLMSALARGARQPITMHCPRCSGLSNDEKLLLHAASLAQANAGHITERVLRNTLVTIRGAECALGPLERLGALFARAWLVFPRRQSVQTQHRTVATTMAWPPDTSRPTIH